MHKMTEGCECAKILLVDDNEYNIYALDLLLDSHGYKSDYASNGKQAIDMVRKKQKDDSCACWYKLILMDCNMPLMDGYTATKILKTNVKEGVLTPMTIIACTAGVTQKDKDRCISV